MSSSSTDPDAVSMMEDQESTEAWTKKTGKSKRKTMSDELSSPGKDVQTRKKTKKAEPHFIVFLRGTAVNLTSRNPVFIEQEIKTRFYDVDSVLLRGVSLKITVHERGAARQHPRVHFTR